jgi:hypothetical protein
MQLDSFITILMNQFLIWVLKEVVIGKDTVITVQMEVISIFLLLMDLL